MRWFVLALLVGFSGQALRAEPTSLKELARMDSNQLQAVFEAAPRPEFLPSGKTRGLVFFQPSKLTSRVQARIFQCLWHGKLLDGEEALMVNRVAGGKFINASMRLDQSFGDGDTAVILDYQGMQKGITKFAEGARDEIREVSPGLWLGRMWVRDKSGLYQPSTWFALQKID